MQRAMIYDENEKVWRTADGRGFGIIDDGMCPEEKKHRLKICNEKSYREFDLINFCRKFQEKIGEFKMNVDLLEPDCQNDFLEISYREISEEDLKKSKLKGYIQSIIPKGKSLSDETLDKIASVYIP